jgi:hypothetical protein
MFSSSPLSSVPLLQNLALLPKRLETIADALFPLRKAVLEPQPSVLRLAVDVVLQLSAHSLSFFSRRLFPQLVSEKPPVPLHMLVGLRSLVKILSPGTGFFDAAPAAGGGLNNNNNNNNNNNKNNNNKL